MVEAELLTYRETVKEIARRAEDLAASWRDEPSVDVARRAGLAWADPTGFRASLLATDRRLLEMQRIIRAIDDVHDALSPEVARLMELVFFQRRSVDICARLLCVDRATIYRWRKGIVAAVAGRLGWQ